MIQISFRYPSKTSYINDQGYSKSLCLFPPSNLGGCSSEDGFVVCFKVYKIYKTRALKVAVHWALKVFVFSTFLYLLVIYIYIFFFMYIYIHIMSSYFLFTQYNTIYMFLLCFEMPLKI